MFVRVKKIGAYEYLYLVENAREGGRHVQRVIKALGRRDEVEASGLIDGLIASAARHSRRTIVLSSFYRGELPELRRVSIGPDLVFGRLWAETGCRDVLTSLLADRRFGFDVERAVYISRFAARQMSISRTTGRACHWHRSFIEHFVQHSLPMAEQNETSTATCWSMKSAKSSKSFWLTLACRGFMYLSSQYFPPTSIASSGSNSK